MNDVRMFAGDYLLFRKVSNGLRKKTGTHPPRFRHKTLEAALAEADRLLALFPESTFVVLQEVGRVKKGEGE